MATSRSSPVGGGGGGTWLGGAEGAEGDVGVKEPPPQQAGLSASSAPPTGPLPGPGPLTRSALAGCVAVPAPGRQQGQVPLAHGQQLVGEAGVEGLHQIIALCGVVGLGGREGRGGVRRGGGL